MNKIFQSILKITFLHVVILLSACNISIPFQSSDALGTLSPDAPVIVGITHVVLDHDPEKNDVFWHHASNIIDSLPAQKGYLGHKVRMQLFGNEAWTMTVWLDEESLDSFVMSEPHSEAMAHGLDAVKIARFSRFTLNRSDLPMAWMDAEVIMNAQGRELYTQKKIKPNATK